MLAIYTSFNASSGVNFPYNLHALCKFFKCSFTNSDTCSCTAVNLLTFTNIDLWLFFLPRKSSTAFATMNDAIAFFKSSGNSFTLMVLLCLSGKINAILFILTGSSSIDTSILDASPSSLNIFLAPI